MRGLKRGKAAAEDGVTIEMLKAAGDVAIKNLTAIANKVYMEGKVTEQMCKSIFITLPKVNGTLDCEKHRIISIMSQITKVILRVILKRIRRKIRAEIADEQFGFTAVKGTSNAIFALRLLAERMIEKQKDLYICFIDYEKAFDRVRHADLMEMLENINIDDRDRKLIKDLYWSQKASVRVDGEETDCQRIKRGVRQGCVLSPDLFALKGEVILRELQDHEGVNVGGRNLNNLRYADDTVLLADSERKLQQLMDKVVEESAKKGLNVNISKTKTMVISKRTPTPVVRIVCGNGVIEQKDAFVYLGSLVTENGKSEAEIKRRIAIAKQTFGRMRGLLTNKKLSLRIRKAVIKTYIWSTLLYGVESWTVSKRMEKRLEAMELWLWRRMMKIPWTARMSNEAVLGVVGERRQIMLAIRKRQLKFLGHVLRRNGTEHLIITGMIEGSRGRGRPREKYMDSLSRLTRDGRRPVQMIQNAQDRKKWKSMVADVLEDMARE